MPIVPLTAEQFQFKSHVRQTAYSFAAKDMLVPVVLGEMSKVVMEMPVGFAAWRDSYIPVAILGLGAASNLFVDADGQWLAKYVPAVYRGHPFSLIKTKDQGSVLCVDDQSPCIGTGEGEALFEHGKPSKLVQGVLQFLSQLQADQDRTYQACQAIERHGLLKPWSLKVNTAQGIQEHHLQGLYCVDTEVLVTLKPQALVELRDSGGLFLMHAHLLSAAHMALLAQRVHEREQSRKAASIETDFEAVSLSFEALGNSG